MKKIVLLAFVLVLLSTVMIGRFIILVEARGTIYIMADGSVDPPAANISSVDNVTYTFTDNVYDEIVVQRDNIVLDGADYILQGTGSGRGIDLSWRSNVTIKNMKIRDFYYGIKLSSSWSNSISGNNIANNDYGIRLSNSSNNIVSGNHITANNYDGIGLTDSSNYNSISGNNITVNNWIGISLIDSSNYNSISGNNITANNMIGIMLIRSSNNIIYGNDITNNKNGIGLYSSSSNIISGNNVVNNECGIWLESSLNCSITGNNLAGNTNYGIYLFGSSGNGIYHNNFVENTQQVYDKSWGYPQLHSSKNVWDNGYPYGGNYWSDYDGTDLFCGSYQNETGSDGIGDISYIIDAENEDKYPLMNPHVLSEMQLFCEEFYELLANYKVLHSKYDNLIASYNSLQVEINDLQSEYNSLTNELNSTRNTMYALMVTTIAFIATTAYLAIRKPKVKSEVKTT